MLRQHGSAGLLKVGTEGGEAPVRVLLELPEIGPLLAGLEAVTSSVPTDA